jgi:murein DD-endopeptidase MepM/ murein hydrolase activator NlpD
MRVLRSAWITILMMACTLTACTPFTTEAASPTPAPSVATIMPLAVTATISPTPNPSPSASPSPTPPEATPLPVSELCSPLDGISLLELLQPDVLKNPFDPPNPGQDGGHQGVDFAYWSRGERRTMLGLPVRSVLDGQVAAALPLRQPYGYAVIVETSLKNLPPAWLSAALIPTPAPTVQPAPNLFCPPGSEVEGLPNRPFPQQYSLYLLYAHLDQPPVVLAGQPVTCGQVIGAAGTTGNSVNVHLHLETRLGPSGATFSSLGHYDNAATSLEMSNYCSWRVSGLFQMFDPLRLLSLQP